MLLILASLGPDPSLKRSVIALLFELNFVLLELAFKAKVGAYAGSVFSDEGDRLLETPGVFFHQVCDHQSRRLGRGNGTLEMPAAQWTSTFPLPKDCSMS